MLNGLYYTTVCLHHPYRWQSRISETCSTFLLLRFFADITPKLCCFWIQMFRLWNALRFVFLITVFL